MQSVLTMSLDGVPYGPVKVTCTDAAGGVALPAAVITYASKNAIRVVISCEDNPIRYGFGIAPTQAGVGHILYPGSTLVLGHPAAVANFLHINHTNGSDAVLQITGEYGA